MNLDASAPSGDASGGLPRAHPPCQCARRGVTESSFAGGKAATESPEKPAALHRRDGLLGNQADEMGGQGGGEKSSAKKPHRLGLRSAPARLARRAQVHAYARETWAWSWLVVMTCVGMRGAAIILGIWILLKATARLTRSQENQDVGRRTTTWTARSRRRTQRRVRMKRRDDRD